MSTRPKYSYEGGVIEITHAGRWVLTPVRSWRYRGTSPYQEIAIADVHFLGTCLFLDGWLQLAEADEYIYHEHLVLPALLAHPHPTRVLILGGGDGLAAREILRHAQVEDVTLVDLDEDVVNACRVHLHHLQEGALEDPRLTIYIGDARDYLQETPSKYDVIIVDLVDLMPDTITLFEDVFAHIPSALNAGGIVVTHGPNPEPPQHGGLLAVAFLRQRFAHTVWYKAFITSFGETWTFAMASHDIDFESLPADTWANRLAQWRGEPRALVPRALPSLFQHPRSETELIDRILSGEWTPLDEQWRAVVLSKEQMARIRRIAGL